MLKTIRNSIIMILVLCMAIVIPVSGSGNIRAAEITATSVLPVTQTVPAENTETNDVIEISETANSGWGIQLARYGIALEKNREYRISFDYTSDTRGAIIRLHKSGDPAACYLDIVADLVPESNTYSHEFVMEYESDPNCILVVELSRAGSDAKNVSIQNFKISPTEDDMPVVNTEVPRIHVDQIGYLLGEKKYAIIISDDPLFEVCNAETDRQVLNGRASEPIMSYSAGEYVRIADFSELSQEGSYYIRNSEAKSYNFTINTNYEKLAESVLGLFEYQKCGIPINDGKWSHDLCHTEPAYIYGTNETRDVSGGWHDAGDYGRYVVPASKTVADILLAYELEFVDDSVLDMARYELEWLLKMQDSKTGGVYHKVTTESFSGEIKPDKDSDKLVISPISAAATADFAAVTAMAARIYSDEFANILLEASRKAWIWLEANPNSPGFKNPKGVTTSEYGDESSLDERYWAACELFHTTGEEIYHEYIKNTIAYQGFGLTDMGFYGSVSYLNSNTNMVDVETFFRIEASVRDAISQIMKAYNDDPYMISLGLDYPWNSNMNAANNAMLLVFAVRMLGDTDYIQPLRDHVHYLLGRNAMSQSYVTGFGTRQVLNPHHRLSASADRVVPGMLVGGPNDGLNDPIAVAMLKGLPPAKAYIDNYYSYSTNEAATYLNSPLYFVLSFLNSR